MEDKINPFRVDGHPQIILGGLVIGQTSVEQESDTTPWASALERVIYWRHHCGRRGFSMYAL
jgi:hypothetical protein